MSKLKDKWELLELRYNGAVAATKPSVIIYSSGRKVEKEVCDYIKGSGRGLTDAIPRILENGWEPIAINNVTWGTFGYFFKRKIIEQE